MTRSERRAARIAVDFLGGDNAPAVVVDGALLALDADEGLRLLPVGPPDVLDRLMARLSAAQRRQVDPVPIRPDGVSAVRAAVGLLAADRVDAVVSAGSTAAAVTAAVADCGRYPALRRPALAVTIPGLRGRLVLLDVGASPNVVPADLVRHAALGVGYAVATLGVTSPRVGLLSIGTEPGSGDRLRRTADDLLAVANLPADARYVGRVEGHHVPLGGPADVVVTDGFTGNVLLKGMEGALGMHGGARFPTSGDATAPRAAVLLGVAAPVVICHGAASGADLASGIALATRVASDHVTDRVARLDEAFRENQTHLLGSGHE
jgi:phosphate acyltransferase